MTIPDLLEYIADYLLAAYLHYEWTIIGGEENLILGYIAHNDDSERTRLEMSGDVVSYLNRQLQSDDLIKCAVAPDLTIKDLNITSIACINE